MSLLTELKRRNVFRMALLYLVSSWLILQVADVLAGLFGLPEWSLRFVGFVLLLGFPIALVFSWVYELTPDGLKREAEIDADRSIAPHTGKRMDRLIIVVLVLVIAALMGDRYLTGADPAASSTPGPAWATTAIEAQPLSIAVLPFSNMSADPANEFFADGIAEEILNLLSGVKDLEVASRTSAFAFKGKDLSLQAIADSLRVQYVLEGSVRKAADQVRITAQLIDAKTDRHLWSDTFDRKLDDIFAVQDEIAGAIGEALEVQLLGAEGSKVSAETLDPKLYETFLEARFLMRQRNPDALRRATAMLESVVEAEPEFARGLVLLAEVLLLESSLEGLSLELEARAEQLARRALALNPRLGNGHMILGSVAGKKGDRMGEYRAYQQAIALEPDEPRPYHWLAILYADAGYTERGLKAIDRSIALEPNNANAHGIRSRVLAALDRLDEAVAAANRQAAEGNPLGHVQAGIFLLPTSSQAAQAAFLRAQEAGFSNPRVLEALLRLVHGDVTDEALISDFEQATASDSDGVLLMAMVMSDRPKAYFSVRAKMKDEQPYDGSMMVDFRPAWQAVRSQDRFMAVLENRGVSALWRALGPPPDCRAEETGFRCGYGNGNGGSEL